jgi:hypothetical protein
MAVSSSLFRPQLLLFLMLSAALLAASMVFAVRIYEDRNLFSLGWIAVWLVLIVISLRAAERRSWALAAAVIVAAMMMRLNAIQLVDDVALGADPMNYTNIAHAMLAGQGMVVDDWQYGNDLRAYFPPFYPFLLTGWWAIFGDSAWSTLAMNSLIDASGALGLYAILAQRKNARAGLLAALLYFAYPPFAFSAPIPQKEALTLMLFIWLLYTTLGWADNRTAKLWRHAAAFGALSAMLALTQASLLVAPAVLGLVLIATCGFAHAFRLGLAALPFFLLVMAPWWVRNWLLFGAFVPLTTASGFMRNVALGEYGAVFPPDLFSRSEVERSALMTSLANAKIIEAPLGFLRETAHALALGFAYEEATLARYRHTTPPISFAARAELAPMLQFSWITALVAALAALWGQFRTRRTEILSTITLALFLSILLAGMWFEFGERHRYILTPMLILIGAAWMMRRGKAAKRF